MRDHEQFCDDPQKEKHFDFDPASKAEYLKKFPLMCHDQPGIRTLDATPRYLALPDIPAKVKTFYSPEDLASKKFIVILREPVARMVPSDDWDRLIA